jgi:hypothetical protein
MEASNEGEGKVEARYRPTIIPDKTLAYTQNDYGRMWQNCPQRLIGNEQEKRQLLEIHVAPQCANIFTGEGRQADVYMCPS